MSPRRSSMSPPVTWDKWPAGRNALASFAQRDFQITPYLADTDRSLYNDLSVSLMEPAMRTISYSEARQNLSATMIKTVEDRAPVLITRQTGEACVLMSLEEYSSLEETAYLLRSPTNARRLLDSIDNLKNGNGV